MWEHFGMCKFEPVLLPGQVLVEMSEKTEMSCMYQVFQALKCLFFKARLVYDNLLTWKVGVAHSSDLKWLISLDQMI